MACPSTPYVLGFARWWGERDSDGHRIYHIVHKIYALDTVTINDGPANVLRTPGLPVPGGIWDFGGDFDINAFCQYDAQVRPMVDERTKYFEVENLYSTRPTGKCIIGIGTGNPATDPLAERPVLSGGFVKYTEEKTVDRFGNFITNSAYERVRGPLVEFDASRLTVRVTINEPALNLDAKIDIIDTVNDSPLWGFEVRQVKLSDITWEQLFESDCTCYFRVTYEFEISREGFDRVVPDEGTKVLNGMWNTTTGEWNLVDIAGNPPDPTNPTHFRRAKDFYNNPMRVVLNGAGIPAIDINGVDVDAPGSIVVEYYPETDFAAVIDNLPSDIECDEIITGQGTGTAGTGTGGTA